jgi:hypothetical protein
MRRFIAILLLAILSSSLSAPLFGLSSNADSNLPACCRRNGKHHCAAGMAMAMQIDRSGKQIRTVSEKCPYCPYATTAAQGHFSPPPPNGAFYASVLSHPSKFAQTEARFRISFDRSRQKRGPPAAAVAS